MNSDILERIASIKDDEAFTERVNNAQNKEDILKLFADYGVTVTEDELDAISERVLSSKELTEDDLEDVDGGCVVGAIMLGVGIVGALIVYHKIKSAGGVSGYAKQQGNRIGSQLNKMW